jgi:hypothetical protein
MTSAILDPTGLTGKATEVTFELAPRKADLSGARVGLLENGKQNARLFLTDVADVLRARYGVGPVIVVRKENFAQPAPAELIDELRSASDLVVVGIGD